MRKIRVYDNKGDFIIEVPDNAKITFGYFNPTRDEGGAFQQPGGYHAQPNVARQTALRIYEKGEKGNQLACFIGVKGFRDESVGLTKMVEEVRIIRTYDDDGEGSMSDNLSRKALMKAVPETDQYS